MKRFYAASLLKNVLQSDAIVICGMGATSWAWREQKAPQPTYYVTDPMGMAMSMALGMALAQPKRQVALLDGDGDFQMSLTALMGVVDAAAKVTNLRMIVFNNMRYESGGGQPLSAAGRFSFATIGRGAGLAWSDEAAEEKEGARKIAALFESPGPGLLAFRIDPEPYSYPPVGPWSKVEDRAVFMRRLTGELP
jgi:thiamine pyrophosphate-dependent acetolactate synthase large subunit-like protein